MSPMIKRVVPPLAAAAAVVGLFAAPAAAAPMEPQTGLTFYQSWGGEPVAGFPDPDGSCQVFPAGATVLVGWSGVDEGVFAYRGADCTGRVSALGTLRSFTAGEFSSFRAR